MYPSPKTIGMIKSRRMRLTGNVTHMEKRGMLIGFWWETRKKETTRKTKHRREDNIKMDLRTEDGEDNGRSESEYPIFRS
jgi:hypothetical protein